MIEVFRPGTSHIVNGITCERATVNEFGFEPLLENGWFLTPEECYPPPEPIKEEPIEKVIAKAVKEVGEAVKEAGEAKDALSKVKERLSSPNKLSKVKK